MADLPTSKAQTATPELRGFIWGGLAWSPDSQMIAVSSIDGIGIYAIDTFDEVAFLPIQYGSTSIDWSPDGTRIAGTSSHFIEIWDVATGQMMAYSEETSTPAQAIQAIKWQPNGSLIASGGWDNTVRIWDGETGELIRAVAIASTGGSAIYDLDWSSDGKYVVVSGGIPTSIIDVQVGQALIQWDNRRENYTVAWQPGGNLVALGRWEGFVDVWNPITEELVMSFRGGQRIIHTIAWSPDGKRLASMGEGYEGDQMMRVWDVETGEMIAEFEGGLFMNSHHANAIAWSPDGKMLASVSDDGHILIWDGNTYELLGAYQKHSPDPY